jgi:hypothetical protein
VYRFVLITVPLALVSGFVNGPAYAQSAVEPSPSDRSNDGNGNHNRNAIGIKSPTSNQGYQHTNNSNAGGLNPTLNALCRKVVKCKMTQNLIVIRVEKRKQPRNIPDRPAEVPVAVPPPTAAPAHHFVHLDPDGITLMK